MSKKSPSTVPATSEVDEHALMHLASGGTIDSHWDAARDTAVPNRFSVIPGYLRDIARVKMPVENQTLFLKDSREISSDDQQDIARKVAETIHKRILLSCGTYLMPDVAREIQEHPQAQFYELFDKRVALTGSLVPMRGFLRSDGGFNLGMSVAVLQEQLKERVLVVMNGLCLDARNVRKDLSSASFSAGSGRDLLPNKDFVLIPAGGTMDFEPSGMDTFIPAHESGIPDFLRDQVRMKRDFSVTAPVLKDSRELTEQDRDLIIKMIRGLCHEHILISMGVYKIREVQRQLRDALAGKLGDKKVVLTASRLPLEHTDKTDAPFQIGYSLGKIGFLEPGIHISLNGSVLDDDQDVVQTVFRPDEIRILKATGVVS